MTLQYLLQTVRKLNPVIDERRTLECISDAVNASISDNYRETLDNECDKRCYDDELKLIMGVAA